MDRCGNFICIDTLCLLFMITVAKYIDTAPLSTIVNIVLDVTLNSTLNVILIVAVMYCLLNFGMLNLKCHLCEVPPVVN